MEQLIERSVVGILLQFFLNVIDDPDWILPGLALQFPGTPSSEEPLLLGRAGDLHLRGTQFLATIDESGLHLEHGDQ